MPKYECDMAPCVKQLEAMAAEVEVERQKKVGARRAADFWREIACGYNSRLYADKLPWREDD